MAGGTRLDFLVNAAAGNGAAQTWPGGTMAFSGEATFSSGSVLLQFQSPHGTWIPVANSTLSANGLLILQLPAGQYRAVGATGSAFYAYGISVPTKQT